MHINPYTNSQSYLSTNLHINIPISIYIYIPILPFYPLIYQYLYSLGIASSIEKYIVKIIIWLNIFMCVHTRKILFNVYLEFLSSEYFCPKQFFQKNNLLYSNKITRAWSLINVMQDNGAKIYYPRACLCAQSKGERLFETFRISRGGHVPAVAVTLQSDIS